MRRPTPEFLTALATHLDVDRGEALRRFQAWAHDEGMDTPIDVTVAAFAIQWFYAQPVR